MPYWDFPTKPYRPGFVAEVVDRFQGVDARNSSVLEANYHIAEVLILCHAESMLTDQDKIGLKGPWKKQNKNKIIWIIRIFHKNSMNVKQTQFRKTEKNLW